MVRTFGGTILQWSFLLCKKNVRGTRKALADELPCSHFWGNPAALRTFKNVAYFCNCAYVLRISRYSGFLWTVPSNTGIFLRGLKLCGQSITQQVLLVSKVKIGSHAFFTDNKASIWKKTPYIALYFRAF